MLKSEQFISQGKHSFTGAVGQQRIGKDYVYNSLFSLPPLNAQKKIVNQINTYFNQLNVIESSLL